MGRPVAAGIAGRASRPECRVGPGGGGVVSVGSARWKPPVGFGLRLGGRHASAYIGGPTQRALRSRGVRFPRGRNRGRLSTLDTAGVWCLATAARTRSGGATVVGTGDGDAGGSGLSPARVACRGGGSAGGAVRRDSASIDGSRPGSNRGPVIGPGPSPVVRDHSAIPGVCGNEVIEGTAPGRAVAPRRAGELRPGQFPRRRGGSRLSRRPIQVTPIGPAGRS